MTKKLSYTVAELADLTQSTYIGDGNRIIHCVAVLEHATVDDASFFLNPKYEHLLAKTKAGVVCIPEGFSPPPHLTVLVNADPSRAIQIIAETFVKDRPPLTGFSSIHSTAVIHPSAIIAEHVEIGPYAVIDQGVRIGAHSKIGAHCYIGPCSVIGEECLLHARVTLREGTEIGNRVILQPGCVLGACGFGYTTSAEGKHSKLEQIGNVIVEDDVEIGANTTIDRARFKHTKIGKGTKIDNLVQIGHNVEVGQNCIIVAQTGVAGSTKIGDYVVIGGQVAIAGHLTIAPKSRIAGKSGVSKSIPTGDWGGIPVQPIHEYNRNAVLLRKMTEFSKTLKQLKADVSRLVGKVD